MTLATLDESALIALNPEVVFGDVDGEIVALNLATGAYLHLNSSGTYIFKQMHDSEGQTLASLMEKVRESYAVDETTCHREVGAFVSHCMELDLLRLSSLSS